MFSIAAPIPDPSAQAAHAAVLARPLTEQRRLADAIRALTIDATEAAQSGHPGLPLGMADVATLLWTRFLRFDAADPRWHDRDRFVLSAGHGAMLLYALLHLTGHAGMGIDQLRNFRQLHAATAGHPEYGAHPAIETTTGPLGQGLGNGVGMALAERLLAARFGASLVDHRTWVLASDGDLMEGISHEAASLAGHLRLHKLVVLYDDNAMSIDGAAGLACSDDVLRRFAACGWATKRVSGHDPAQLAAAFAFAMRAKRPTLLACNTIIGFSAPSKAGSAASHGTPLGSTEAAAAKQALGWTYPPFSVPPELAAAWKRAGHRGAGARRAWLKRLAGHPLRAEFERSMAGRLPEFWHEALAAVKTRFVQTRPHVATRQASGAVLDALAPAIPELLGGAADLAQSTYTRAEGMAAVTQGNFTGRFVHYGVREHGMAAAMNGLALHGGLIPYGGTYLVFSDYLRPALRLAALMHQRVIYVLTHDSIGLGQDGPTHQPVEQLAGLRAMPNLLVLRPADAIETAECWELALRRTEGPSVLALSRQPMSAWRTEASENRSARGGYVLAEAEGPRDATLIASGSEIGIAMAARADLATQGIAVAVVSLPCWSLFAGQDAAWRGAVLGSAPRIAIEAGSRFGWDMWLRPEDGMLGLDNFGASGRAEDVYRHFGLTPEAVVAATRKRTTQQTGAEVTPGSRNVDF